jgi:hypothetical protein
MWVIKTSPDTDAIDAFCPVCLTYELRIVRWQDTLWADGVMVPLRRPSVHPDLSWPRSEAGARDDGGGAAGASSGTVVKGDRRGPEETPTHHDGIAIVRR